MNRLMLVPRIFALIVLVLVELCLPKREPIQRDDFPGHSQADIRP